MSDLPFDDRLDGDEAPDDGEGVFDVAEALAIERAEADAPDGSARGAGYCAACVEDTPLAYNWASDIGTVTFMRDLAAATASRLVELGAAADDGPIGWVESELSDAYIDAYYEACVEPEECEVCRHPDGYDECGHERYGEECPARGGEVLP